MKVGVKTLYVSIVVYSYAKCFGRTGTWQRILILKAFGISFYEEMKGDENELLNFVTITCLSAESFIFNKFKNDE